MEWQKYQMMQNFMAKQQSLKYNNKQTEEVNYFQTGKYMSS